MTFFPEDASNYWQAIIGAGLAYVAIIAAVRLVGLRSFAKMASHDFAVTVAIGSVLAGSAMASSTPLAVPLSAILVLFGLQFAMSWMLSASERFSNVTQNTPLLLMEGSEILHENLKASQISERELRAKLREANVLRLTQVKAVVFEGTGDVSVLHGPENVDLEDQLLTGVRRSP